MDRPRRDSRQQNGITVQGLSQLTSATKSANRRTEQAYSWPGSSACDRCRAPREVVGPKVDYDGSQAQSYADPENRRMMDRSSVARSWLHSITSSVRASSEDGTARPSALTGFRLITSSSTPIAERPGPPTPTRPAWREDVRTRRRLLIPTFSADQAL